MTPDIFHLGCSTPRIGSNNPRVSPNPPHLPSFISYSIAALRVGRHNHPSGVDRTGSGMRGGRGWWRWWQEEKVAGGEATNDASNDASQLPMAFPAAW